MKIPFCEPMNNLFLNGKIVSIFQLLIFVVFVKTGLKGLEISNTLRSALDTVYILLLIIANRAIEPAWPIGEVDLLPELWAAALLLRKNPPGTNNWIPRLQ